MAIKCSYDDEFDLIRITTYGFTSIEDLKKIPQTLVEDSLTATCRLVLHDMRDSIMKCTGVELGSSLDHLKDVHRTRIARIALLVRNQVQYGTARQFQAYFAGENASRVFTDESDAICWLHTHLEHSK
jgi:hypothetical protein